jgi:hypothetical protein
MRIVLFIVMVTAALAAQGDPPDWLRCQLPNGEIIELYIPELGGIGGAHQACRDLGGKVRGVRPK